MDDGDDVGGAARMVVMTTRGWEGMGLGRGSWIGFGCFCATKLPD